MSKRGIHPEPQYKNKRPDYLANFFEVVNWKDVEARFAAATA